VRANFYRQNQANSRIDAIESNVDQDVSVDADVVHKSVTVTEGSTANITGSKVDAWDLTTARVNQDLKTTATPYFPIVNVNGSTFTGTNVDAWKTIEAQVNQDLTVGSNPEFGQVDVDTESVTSTSIASWNDTATKVNQDVKTTAEPIFNKMTVQREVSADGIQNVKSVRLKKDSAADLNDFGPSIGIFAEDTVNDTLLGEVNATFDGDKDTSRIDFRARDSAAISTYISIGGGATVTPLAKDVTTGSGANVYMDPSTGELMRSTSSLRYKDVVGPTGVDSSKIHSIQLIEYNEKRETVLRESKTKTVRYHKNVKIGPMVEQVEEVCPWLVVYRRVRDDKGALGAPEPDAMDINSLVYTMLLEIQRLESKLSLIQQQLSEI
jgi:hypothetical protein